MRLLQGHQRRERRVGARTRAAAALALSAALLTAATTARAIAFTPFDADARGGDLYGQTWTIGDGGEVHIFDAFVSVGGMTVEEVAHVLSVSKTTVEADWRMARAWIRRELTSGTQS